MLESKEQLNLPQTTGWEITSCFTVKAHYNFDSDAILNLNDSTIRCNISGTGSIYVDFNAELIIEKDAVIDFGTLVDPTANGRILCDGLLRVKDDARIMDAEVHVRRSSVEDNAIILNSVVTAEAGSPFGQFYIEDNVELWLDSINADGAPIP